MNNEEKWMEELSAYLDGEAADKKTVEQFLQRDPALARRVEDYTRMGALLRSMPDPDVHPAFATRVVAHALEAGPARPALRWWQVLMPAAAVAAVMLYVFAVQLQNNAAPATQPSTQVAATIAPDDPIIPRNDWTNEESVVGAMETLIDQGVTFEVYGTEVAPEAELEAPLETEAPVTSEPAAKEGVEPMTPEWGQQIAREVYAYVSDPYWNSPQSEVLWFRPDVEQEIESMSAPEQRLFQELLRSYQENG